jgi:hypothetical protein
MSAETVVKTMVQRRLDEGMERAAAYAAVDAILDADMTDLRERAEALRHHLEAAHAPPEYKEDRLSSFSYMIERQILFKFTARQLDQHGWPHHPAQ